MKKIILFLIGLSMIGTMATTTYADTINQILASKPNVQVIQQNNKQGSLINNMKNSKNKIESETTLEIIKGIYDYGGEKIEKNKVLDRLIKEEIVEKRTYSEDT